jgi:hypothetical protein
LLHVAMIRNGRHPWNIVTYKNAALLRHLCRNWQLWTPLLRSASEICLQLISTTSILCSSHLSSARTMTRTRIGDQPRVPPIYPPASHRDLYAASLHRLQGDSLAIPSFFTSVRCATKSRFASSFS